MGSRSGGEGTFVVVDRYAIALSSLARLLTLSLCACRCGVFWAEG